MPVLPLIAFAAQACKIIVVWVLCKLADKQ